MNDRFKFRVWDTEIKEYLVGCFLVGGSNMIHNSVDYESFLNKGNFVIEQCTGLKDKNGNLIYEGDVVKEPLLGREYIIKWKSDDAMFEAIATVYDTEFEEIYGLYADNAKELEIIGNIHEQAEQKDK